MAGFSLETDAKEESAVIDVIDRVYNAQSINSQPL
jgi:hypothetical protein